MYVDASLDAHPLWTTAYHFPDSTAQFLDEADESQALSASFMDTGSPRVSAANFYSISEQAFQQCQKDGQGKASQSHLISFLAELLQQQAAQVRLRTLCCISTTAPLRTAMMWFSAVFLLHFSSSDSLPATLSVTV